MSHAWTVHGDQRILTLNLTARAKVHSSFRLYVSITDRLPRRRWAAEMFRCCDFQVLTAAPMIAPVKRTQSLMMCAPVLTAMFFVRM
ncbi:hypothetical protein EDF23_11524 [Curtobacterium sp. PhB128]|nr:hypothetical protein EDF41_3275 [Curtobacterium sp. PhB171]ROQ22351.1 hypothetical protein EDF40_3443 [Curtobacterium sp. PhB170]ROS33711.1 hypothetical protein EDF25_3098 [Curtobacterium sp. PhB131]TCL71529.1 hypothetical protein EDF23_11524 [Curtobacterium sp. PhB128]TCL90040.1 hypothetical protein EDF29_11524 [Curtobacterium sp. PhB138]